MAALKAVKVTLSTKKVVILRDMRITDTEKAAQLAAPQSNDDKNVLQVLMQKELVKLVLLQVDGKEVTPQQREDMDSLFSISEYGQILKVVAKMSGADDEKKEPAMEIVSVS